MANYREAKVKLTSTQLNKLKCAAKKNKRKCAAKKNKSNNIKNK